MFSTTPKTEGILSSLKPVIILDSSPSSSFGSLKFDHGKAPLGLLSPIFKRGIARVLAFGKEKYGAWNWMETGFETSRLLDAIQRHLDAYLEGEDIDPESGEPHLYHAACGLMFLCHQHSMPERYGHLDDRPEF